MATKNTPTRMAITMSSRRTSIRESCHAHRVMSHPNEGIAVLAPASDLNDVDLDAPAGGWVFCEDLGSAQEAVRRGVAGDRIVVQVAPAEVATAVTAGWRALVDVD